MVKLTGAAKRKFLARMAKGRRDAKKPKARKTSTRKAPKRRTSTKVNRKAPKRRNMAKNKGAPRKKSGFVSPKIKKLAKTVIIGVGTGAAIETVGNLVGRPGLSRNGLIPAAVAFVADGPTAGAIALITSGGLGSILGGGGNGTDPGGI